MGRNMPQDTLSFLQRIQEYGLVGYAWLFVLSIWAGTAKYLNSLDGDKPTFLGWLTESSVSGFVGVVAAMTCQYYQIDFMLTAAITGICAHNGTKSLSVISRLIKKNSQIISITEDHKKRPKLNRKDGKK